jgi:hypothetical protein
MADVAVGTDLVPGTDLAPHTELGPVLLRVRRLAADPWRVDDAIETLDELARSLEPDLGAPGGDDGARLADPLRTVLSTHLLALQALRDVAASDETVVKVVRRAVDAVEHVVLAVRIT